LSIHLRTCVPGTGFALTDAPVALDDMLASRDRIYLRDVYLGAHFGWAMQFRTIARKEPPDCRSGQEDQDAPRRAKPEPAKLADHTLPELSRRACHDSLTVCTGFNKRAVYEDGELPPEWSVAQRRGRTPRAG
jgi:hypothetical protein